MFKRRTKPGWLNTVTVYGPYTAVYDANTASLRSYTVKYGSYTCRILLETRPVFYDRIYTVPYTVCLRLKYDGRIWPYFSRISPYLSRIWPCFSSICAVLALHTVLRNVVFICAFRYGRNGGYTFLFSFRNGINNFLFLNQYLPLKLLFELI